MIIMQNQSVSVLKYILMCLGINILAGIVIGVMEEVFTINISSGIALGLSIAAATMVGTLFGKHQGRAPTSSEKHRFAAGSLAIQVAIAIALLGGIRAFDDTGMDLSSMKLDDLIYILAGFLVVICAMLYFAFYFSFGWGAKRGIVVENDAVAKTFD